MHAALCKPMVHATKLSAFRVDLRRTVAFATTFGSISAAGGTRGAIALATALFLRSLPPLASLPPPLPSLAGPGAGSVASGAGGVTCLGCWGNLLRPSTGSGTGLLVESPALLEDDLAIIELRYSKDLSRSPSRAMSYFET